jgi:ABC-2 type transport system permease protein
VLRSVVLKTLGDQRRSLPAWAVSLVLLVGMYAAVYPTVRDNTTYSDFINEMPKSFRALFTAGGVGDFTSGPGYVYVELLSLMGPLLLCVFSIGAGASAIAGEEDRHTLDLLLGTPVPRGRVVLGKFAAMLGGLGVLGLALWAGLVGLGASVDMGLGLANTAAAVTHLALLAAEFGTMALLVGCATGRIGLARAIPALVAVVSYVVNGLANTVGWLEPAQKYSPFFQYIGHDPIRHGFSLVALGVTVGSIAVLVLAAVALFRRRDVLA